MGRKSQALMANAQAADARLLLELKKVPPPPGSKPLDLPGYNETQDPWVQPEFAAWHVSSQADRESGAWREHPSLAGTEWSRDAVTARSVRDNPSGRTTATDSVATQAWQQSFSLGGDGGASEAVAPSLAPRFDAALAYDDGRYITRPSSDSGDEDMIDRMPYAESQLGSDALEAPAAGWDWTSIALLVGAGVILYFVARS